MNAYIDNSKLDSLLKSSYDRLLASHLKGLYNDS